MAQETMNSKLAEIKAHREARRVRQFDQAARGGIWFATGVVAVTALALGAWSNQTVAQFLGVKGLAGWGAALVIDGIWLVSLAIVQLHRHEPWRALSAYRATLWMVALSAVTNFAHGLIRFEVTWRGAAAGLLFALLPISLKWLVAVSTKNAMGQLLKAPDAKNRIKQAGQITAEHQLNEVLAPVARLIEPVERVEVHRVGVEKPQVTWVGDKPPGRIIEPPAEASVVDRSVTPRAPLGNAAPTLRQERVEDLAKLISERGGQPGSVTLSEVAERYGVNAKATASNLRKDAHAAYLANTSTGMYM
jgi:hypothetical protein